MISFLKPLSIKGKIRIGPHFDGGYVVYGRLLEETDALLTYGVGWDISFEKQFYKRTRKRIVMFDPSMFGKYLFSVRYLRELRLKPRLWKIYFSVLWFLRAYTRHKEAQVLFINEGVSSVKKDKFDTLSSHLQRFNLENRRLLLKIDIEGGEYDIFSDNDIYKHFKSVNQIIMEFHDLEKRLREAQHIITILRQEFELVHVHGNNYGRTFVFHDPLKGEVIVPDVLEVTFVRRERIRAGDIHQHEVVYPMNALDYPNNPSRRDYALDFINS